MSYPQQPYGQDPYGQGTYGQSYEQAQYGQPQYGGGYTPGEPPKKSNTGMIVAIVVIVVLVLGGGVTTAIVLAGGDDKPTAEGGTSSTKKEPTTEDDPTTEDTTTEDEPTTEDTTDIGGGSGDESAILSVADSYLSALNSTDQAAATSLVCNQTDAGLVFTSFSSFGYHWVLDDTSVSASAGFATVNIYPDHDQSLSFPLSLNEDGSSWCIAY